MNLGLFSAYNGFIDTFRSMLEEWLESSCSAVILGDLLLVCRLYDGMVSLIHFRVTPGKWLESACNVVILGCLRSI